MPKHPRRNILGEVQAAGLTQLDLGDCPRDRPSLVPPSSSAFRAGEPHHRLGECHALVLRDKGDDVAALEIALATTKHLLAEVRREPVECPHKGGAKTNNLFSRAGTTQAPFAAVDASLLNLEHDIAHRARSI
jgi:hypothetical protein